MAKMKALAAAEAADSPITPERLLACFAQWEALRRGLPEVANYLKPRQYAELFDISEDLIVDAVKEGQFERTKCVHRDELIEISRASFVEWLESCRIPFSISPRASEFCATVERLGEHIRQSRATENELRAEAQRLDVEMSMVSNAEQTRRAEARERERQAAREAGMVQPREIPPWRKRQEQRERSAAMAND